jgi:hypothetical protein
MFKGEADDVAGNSEEDYLRHFGFTVEDLSFLISPQSSLSPIKKKQRNVFNFDAYQEEGDAEVSALGPVVAPGPYPGNYQTVYEPESAANEEPMNEHLPLPSFEGLDLASFDQMIDGVPAPSTFSTAATAGSGTSTIQTEQPSRHVEMDSRAGFGRMESNAMNMGSLAFSTMSSFNFDEAEAEEMSNFAKSASTNPAGTMFSNSAIGIGMYPYSGADPHHLPPPQLPSLVQMTGGVHPPLICMEDASFIINAQQLQLNQQQQLLEQQQRALNSTQWFQTTDMPHPSALSDGHGTTSQPGSQPVSRIGSFRSQLPPLSVDLHALNAAHHAHQQAKLLAQNGGHSSSAYSLMFPGTAGQLSYRSAGSSEASSPERSEPPSAGGARKSTPRDERHGSEGSMGAVATAALGSMSANGKEDASRASKSLATISRRFVEHFGDADTFDYISGQLHVNDVHGKSSPPPYCVLVEKEHLTNAVADVALVVVFRWPSGNEPGGRRLRSAWRARTAHLRAHQDT